MIHRIVSEAASPSKKILTTPISSLEIEWEDGIASDLSWNEWVSLMKETLGELHANLGRLHLDETMGCNPIHCQVLMSAIAGMTDLLTNNLPARPVQKDKGSKKWRSRLDTLDSVLEGLHAKYGEVSASIDSLSRRLDQVLTDRPTTQELAAAITHAWANRPDTEKPDDA